MARVKENDRIIETFRFYESVKNTSSYAKIDVNIAWHVNLDNQDPEVAYLSLSTHGQGSVYINKDHPVESLNSMITVLVEARDLIIEKTGSPNEQTDTT